jgi:hypothetical protein
MRLIDSALNTTGNKTETITKNGGNEDWIEIRDQKIESEILNEIKIKVKNKD